MQYTTVSLIMQRRLRADIHTIKILLELQLYQRLLGHPDVAPQRVLDKYIFLQVPVEAGLGFSLDQLAVCPGSQQSPIHIYDFHAAQV
jgi:hypothetical protein